MSTTIKGRYVKGEFILEAPPPTDEAEIVVTFTRLKENVKKSPVFGYGKGTFGQLPPDFNDPLEDLKEYM